MGSLVIATIIDEADPLTAGHQSIGEFERLQKDLVVWALVVEAEFGAFVTDALDPALELLPSDRRRVLC